MTNFQLFSYILLLCAPFIIASEKTLKSVSVIFRHGDRTPQEYPTGFYPNDPYLHYDFGYLGHGGLTNDGKRREYEIGTSLRKRYDEFLDKTYFSSNVSVVSSDTERTKMSLLLVLAGLYPPKDQQIWKSDLDWQPIPIDSIPEDLPSISKYKNCPKYKEHSEKVQNSRKYKQELSRFDELRKNLTIFTGRDVNNIEIAYHLYHTLTAEKAMGLQLPEWTKDYYPHKLIDAVLFQYQTENYDNTLMKLGGGLLLRKVLNDWSLNEENRPKVNLYSFHENHIAAVLYAAGIWRNVIPQYSSAIVFELHKINNEYFVKMLYYKGIPAEFEEETIPGCTKYCPIEKFLVFRKEVIPDDTVEACFGPVSDSQLIPKSVNPVQWAYDKIKKWFNL